MFKDLENTKEKQLEQINQLTLDSREEKNLKDRLRSFRKYFDSNKPLKKFDKAVFDSIVERIILGGVNDQGQNDPYLITFVFKTGPKPSVSVGKEGKNGAVKSIGEITGNLYSQPLDHTCGVCSKTTTPKALLLLEFKNFYDFFSFSKNSDNYHQKDLKNSIKIKIAI